MGLDIDPRATNLSRPLLEEIVRIGEAEWPATGMTAADVARVHALVADGTRLARQAGREPMFAAPTWQLSTAYSSGMSVRGTGADADSLYFLAGNASTAGGADGTSAATGSGPSGQGDAVISDGTCRWQYIGPASAQRADVPLLSTAALVDGSSKMNGLLQSIPAALTGALGLSFYGPADLEADVVVTGGLYGARNAGRVNGPNSGTLISPSYPSSMERSGILFVTNSRKWIALRSGPHYKNRAWDVLVNGQRLCESQFSLASDSANTVLLVNLSVFPDGDKTIAIRKQDGLSANMFNAFYLEQGAAVWRPAVSAERWAFDGDSITQGSYFAGSQPQFWMETLVADYFGHALTYNNAVGGTGAISSGPGGTKTTYAQRLADLIAFSPTRVVIGGFHNDMLSPSQERQSAFLGYLQSIRSGLPNARIYLVGTQLLHGESLTPGAGTPHSLEVDAKAAFDAWGDQNAVFIPLMTRQRVPLTAANGKHYQNGAAPFNDAHPTPAYYPFFAGLMASAIAAAG